MATTIDLPLVPVSVNLSNSNCYWAAIDGTTFDYASFNYLDAVTGISTWKLPDLPGYLNATENWKLRFKHERLANGGAGNNVVLAVSGRLVANSAVIDSTLTSLYSTTMVVDIAGDLTTTDTSALDATLSLDSNSGSDLYVVVQRTGGNGSDNIDTLWRLYEVILLADV